MKKTTIALILLALTGCATTAYPTASQNYRQKGSDEQIKITSKFLHESKFVSDEYAVLFNIDDQPALAFQLDNGGNGSFSCDKQVKDESKDNAHYCYPHNGNKIGGQCISSTTNGKVSSAYCTFTYNGEQAANFKF